MAQPVVVSLIALFFGAVAVVLSFVAYSKRIKAEEVGGTTFTGCTYPEKPSFTLGIAAAFALLVEQIATSVVWGLGVIAVQEIFAPRPVRVVQDSSSYFPAFVGLIYTAIVNNNVALAEAFPGKNGDDCRIGRESMILGAAIWCIITVILGFVSYISLKADRNTSMQLLNRVDL